MKKIGYLKVKALCAAVAGVFVLSSHAQESTMQKADEDLTISQGKPVQFPPGPPAPLPNQPITQPTPVGITPIAIPAVVREPPARYIVNPVPGADAVRAMVPPKPAKAKPRGRGVLFEGKLPTEQEGESLALKAAALSDSFDSTDFDDNITNTGGFAFIPPDPSAAAGPDHLVNVTNVTVRFHQKDGTLDFNSSLASFFASLSPLTFTFDPKVIYDQFAQRFVIVTLEQTDTAAGDAADTSRILLAVSDDADPNGTWYMTEFNSKITIGGVDRWADYPGFAVDEEAVYITNNMFGFGASGGAYGGVRLWVVDKGEVGGFYAGSAASVSVLDPYTPAGSIATTTQPAHIFGTAPTDVGTFLVSYSGLSGGGNEFVQIVRIDDPLGTPTFTQQFLSFGNVEDTFVMPDAPQLDTATLVETNDQRALHAVWRDDSLWLTTTISPKAGDPDAGEATAYWLELDTSTLSSISVADQGALGGEDIATATHTFFPAIAVNSAHDVMIGFSGSASTIYPGAYYTTRQLADAAGTTAGSETLRAGVDYYIRTLGGGDLIVGGITAERQSIRLTSVSGFTMNMLWPEGQ